MLVPPAWLVGVFVPQALVALAHWLLGPESWLPFVETVYSYFSEAIRAAVGGICPVWFAAKMSPSANKTVAVCAVVVLVLVMGFILLFLFAASRWTQIGVWGFLWELVQFLILITAGIMTASAIEGEP